MEREEVSSWIRNGASFWKGILERKKEIKKERNKVKERKKERKTKSKYSERATNGKKSKWICIERYKKKERKKK